MPSAQGAVRLFRFKGIDVFLHWSWFVVAVFELRERSAQYGSPVWNAVEYLALFAIVTLHEFGHSLACRQVGGSANRIVLWPLGGVAYVDPPQRPGATLWSIAAGPLVNVALVPALFGLELLAGGLGLPAAGDARRALHAVTWVNAVILAFNLLPVYPLDGGQILRSLLWFALGRARSLYVATAVGFLGVLGLVLLARQQDSLWLGILAAFVALNCWSGFQHARALSRMAKLPRHAGFACPSCKASPPVGAFWVCGACRTPFDSFEAHATCPTCGTSFAIVRCVDCGRESPIQEWARAFGKG